MYTFIPNANSHKLSEEELDNLKAALDSGKKPFRCSLGLVSIVPSGQPNEGAVYVGDVDIGFLCTNPAQHANRFSMANRALNDGQGYVAPAPAVDIEATIAKAVAAALAAQAKDDKPSDKGIATSPG